MIEKWRQVFRIGIAPQLSLAGLEALRVALVEDDSRLIQGRTVSPPAVYDWLKCEVEECCVITFCGWRGDGKLIVEEAAEHFARVCDAAGIVLQEPVICRYFLKWYDEAPRTEMRRELLPEVELAIQAKGEQL